MICSRVDLPQPDGPIIETKLPLSTSRSTPLSATVLPPAAGKLFCTQRTPRIILPGWFMAPSRREDTLGKVNRRLQKTVFLHHLYRVGHFLYVDRSAKPRQQDLVL